MASLLYIFILEFKVSLSGSQIWSILPLSLVFFEKMFFLDFGSKICITHSFKSFRCLDKWRKIKSADFDSHNLRVHELSKIKNWQVCSKSRW